MRLKLGIILFLIVLVSSPLLAADYTSDDLWILEVMINEDVASCQSIDGLVMDEGVFLPVAPVASILKIPLNINHSQGIYSFLRPGDQVSMVVDFNRKVIEVNNGKESLEPQMMLINGELFLPVEIYDLLMDAEFIYDSEHLVVYINTDHLEKRDGKRKLQEMIAEQGKKDLPPFSISNIKYFFNSQWEKQTSLIKINGANAGSENPSRDEEGETDQAETDLVIEKSVTESWKSLLRLDMKGTIYDWDYRLGTEISHQDQERIKAELSSYVLTYDMDQSRFYLGKLHVNTEPELSLKTATFEGVSLVSRTSPLFRMNGNLIQIAGEAPEGSKVKLYVNGWLADECLVKSDEVYLFTDVLLSYSDMVNEVKVALKKPGGVREELYRYISVSDTILNPGEINYLVQGGKLKAEDEAQADNYLLNSIVYWGISEKTTLGLAWYGELAADQREKDLVAYSYNSLRLNQRLSDYWIAQGVLYNVFTAQGEEKEQNLGYKLNLDYKNPQLQAGLAYHKEGRTYKEEGETPYETYRLYLIQQLEEQGWQGQVEGKLGYDRQVDDPEERRQLYQLGFKAGAEKWESSVVGQRNVYQGARPNWQNTLHASLGYLIRPNLKLLQSVKYEGKWNQRLVENLGLGLEGSLAVDSHTFILGVDWLGNLTDQQTRTDYSLAWANRYKITKQQYLLTNLAYQYQALEGNDQQIIPLSIQYSYMLPNDAQLKLAYRGQWEKSVQHEEIDHKLTLSLEGAFNFFGGKIVSTSPHSAGTQIGVVSGRVFKDTNRNGQFDEGEELLADIPVRLDRKVQLTDAEGQFSFKNIPHGVHYLGFDYSQLPIELTPSTADKNVKVVANGEVTEDLGLYIVGAVDGTVYVDDLPGSLNLKGIRLVAKPGDYTVETGSDGYYYFDQLPPGKYQINLDPTSLPAWILNQAIEPQPIEITEAGEYIGGVDFTLQMDPGYGEAESGAVEEVEVIPVVPAPVEPEESEDPVEETPETIAGMEDSLVELSDHILRVDLATKTATMNGEEVTFDPFFLQDESVWAPIRAIAQLFDCKVYWDLENQRVYVVDQDRNILFDVEIGYVMVNGQKVDLQNGIRLIDGYTFVTLEDLQVLGLSSQMVDQKLLIYSEEND